MSRLIVALIILFFSSTAVAAPKRIKGKLTTPEEVSSYRLIALDQAGNTFGIGAFNEAPRFSLSAKRQRRFSLSLTREGSYYGSVIFAIKRGKKIVPFQKAVSTGLCADGDAKAVMSGRFNKKAAKRAGKVGSIVVSEELGIAYLTRRVPRKLLNLKQLSDVDTTCIPVGDAGKQGYSLTSSEAFLFVGEDGDIDQDGIDDLDDGDMDGDGVPNIFDQDRDNNGILDLYNSVGQSNSDQDDPDEDDEGDDEPIEEDEELEFLYFFSNNTSFIGNAVNFNVAGTTDEDVDTSFQSTVNLAIKIAGGGESDVELDCNGNSYCSPAGTGTIANFGGSCPAGEAFPDQFDPDGDDKGDVVNQEDEINLVSCNPFSSLFLKTNTSQSNINPGDVLIQEVRDEDGDLNLRPLTLDFVMNTHPTPVSVETALGTTMFDYPVLAGEPGTDGNCIQYSAANPVVTVTAYRPTRAGLEASGESEKMTMGRLIYQLSAFPSGGLPTGSIACSFEAYSEIDENLELQEGSAEGEDYGVVDTLGDQDFDVDDNNTVTFTVDLSQCPQLGGTSGVKQVDIKARNSKNDNSAVIFCMEGV